MLWTFFPLNLKAFFKADLVFKEGFTFLQQVISFFFEKIEIFGGPVIDFPWCSRFFVIQDCFSMKSIGF